MSKKTEAMKARLSDAQHGVFAEGDSLENVLRDARSTTCRQERQLMALEKFASFTHGFAHRLYQDKVVPAKLISPLITQLQNLQNDLKRTTDPDDKGCCG